MAQRRWYPTDLTDTAWALLAPLWPPAKPGGRPRSTDRRAGLTALSDWRRSGGAWHRVPHDFPPWQTVYPSWRSWRLSGDGERIQASVRARVRQRAGREPTPSAGIVDRQSVTTTQRNGGGPRAATGRMAASK